MDEPKPNVLHDFSTNNEPIEVNFWEYFLLLLPHRPKKALASLYWHMTRRRMRARNCLRIASADLSFPYAVWIERVERTSDQISRAPNIIAQWSARPTFEVALVSPPVYTDEQLNRSIRSIERQTYSGILISKRPIDVASIAAEAGADFVVPLQVGDELSETALFRFAEALQDNPGADILYGDEDQLSERGERREPWFKPDWNPEMFLAQNYLSSAIAIRTTLVREIGAQKRNLSELLLEATAKPSAQIVHLPHILCHVRHHGEDRLEWLAAVQRHMASQGITCVAGPFDTVKVQWPLPDELPLVSIIIPTRDKVEFLEPCLRSVLERTDYRNLEIIIVDNGSVEPATKDYLRRIGEDPRVRVVAFPGPYNFSAINNFAALQARGSYLCLLNNDTEVIEGGWLTEMARYATRADVGAVGAKLLYDDGSIQHAGVVIGIGGAAGHAHRFLPARSSGYFRQPHVAQFVSAVTGACLLVEKRKFLAVGGLDEIELPVAFNDVDLCLKLQAAGWRNVYTPHAVLVHHESKTRESDTSRKNIDRFRREIRALQDRWHTDTYKDPSHNPNLDRATETFTVRISDDDAQRAA